MAGGKWAHKVQWGRESTPGTAVAATAIWRGIGGMLKDKTEVVMVDELIGIALPTTRNYIGKQASSLALAATEATFEQIFHIFEAGIKSVGTGASDGGGSGKIYAYPVGMTSVNTVKTYTIETGDNEQAEEADYCFVEKFVLSGERGKAVMVSADWVGRKVSTTTFTGSLTVPTVEHILAPRSRFHINDVDEAFGDTLVSQTLLKWELSVETGWRPKFTLDSALSGGGLEHSFIYFDRDSFKGEFSATFEHNATAVAQKALFQAGTPRLMQLKVPGSNLGTAGTTYSSKWLIINAVLVYTEWDVLDSEDGNSIVNVKGTIGYDPTAAKALEIIVVNELSSVP